MTDCEDSIEDCEGSRNCIPHQDWMASDKNSSCECQWFLGLVGEECDEFSAVAVGIAVIHFATLFFFLFLLSWEVYLYYQMWRNNKLDVRSALFTTLTFVVISSINAFLFAAIKIYAIFNGDQYSIVGNEKQYVFYDATNAVFAIELFAMLSASLNTSVLWLEITKRVARMDVASKDAKNITTYATSVKSFCGVFGIVLFALLVSGLEAVAISVSIPVFLLLIGVFYYSYSKLGYLISRTSSSASDKMQQTKARAKRVTISVTVLIVFGMIGALTVFFQEMVLDPQDKVPQSGSPVTPTWGNCLMMVSGALINGALVLYLAPLTRASSSSSSAASSSNSSNKGASMRPGQTLGDHPSTPSIQPHSTASPQQSAGKVVPASTSPKDNSHDDNGTQS